MPEPIVSKTPTIWTDAQLAEEASKAIAEFVSRRLAEPGGVYLHHVAARRKALIRLFRAFSSINLNDPDFKAVRAVLYNEETFDALRYVAGPPISEDDLGVLVKQSAERIKKREIQKNDLIVAKIVTLVRKLADPVRFPWIAANRRPTLREIKLAIRTTSTLHASQSLQTERRAYGKVVEHRLEIRLTELGFTKTPTPNRAKIDDPIHYPKYPNFYGECTVHGRKVDLFIALPTGRVVALEAKDSSSGLNSVKRLNNDTAAKAKHFAEHAGKNLINVALLSGVFKISSLTNAQDAGLYIVWAHDMDGFIEWIKSQTHE